MNQGFKLYFDDGIEYISRSSLEKVTDGTMTVYSVRVRNAIVDWRFENIGCGSIVTMQVSGDEALHIKRIDSLCVEDVGYNETDRVLFFGNNMLASEHRYPCELAEGAERSADCTGLFENLGVSGMAIAMVSPFRNAVGAGARIESGRLSFFAKTEFTDAMQQERFIEVERVFFADSISIQKLYDAYRALLPKSSFPMPKLVGWNTWDYYLNRVTPEDIFENIEAMSKMSFADKIDYIVIDDGWQKEWGIWSENEKFSCGLAHVADRIKECGFMAGIWMAPLLMKNSCEGFEERMHWFCRDESGNYLRSEGGTYVIDPTLPEAEEFILNNYRYLYSCGYRLFKIDYLSPLTKIRNFYDKNATPYSALSKLILRIQEATGEDAVILGCSLPVQCGADIAPSMRIGVDIHNHFSHVKWIAESLSWTWMYNNRTTRIDPDFLVVRGLETADEPLIWEGTPNYTAPKRRQDMSDTEFFRSRWRQGDQFNAIEAETWSNLVAISGGNIFLSDKMSVLNQKGIEIIERAFDAASEECRPYYLETDSRLPSLWRGDNRILLINWDDEPKKVNLSLDANGISSVKPYLLENGILTVTLKPHESFFATII